MAQHAVARLATRTATMALAAAALWAAPAGAVTDIHGLLQTTSSDISGVGPSNSGSSFVFTSGCDVERVIPGGGSDTGTATTVAGQGCGVSAHGVTAVATAATSVSLAGGLVAGTAGDDGFLVADPSKAIVDRYVSNTIQTFAGTGTCGSPPAESSLAKDANLCLIWSLAADPANSGRFAVADAGDGTTNANERVYLVNGTTRANATIQSVAGGCQPAPAVPALRLCFPGVFDIAFAGSDTLLISQNGELDAVSLVDGSATSLLPAYDGDLREVTGGFAGDAYFTSGCLVKRISALDGTGSITTVAGNGSCDPAGRVNDQPASATSLQPARLASYPGGLFVTETDAIRLIDRSSITSHPARYTQDRDASLGYATLSGGHTHCSFGGTLGGAFSFADCNNPYTESGQLDDDYSFTVAEDEGTVDPTPAGWNWTVDTIDPTTPAPSAPADSAHVDSASPLFQWSASSDPGRDTGFIQIPGSGVDRYELLIDGVVDSDAACCETHPAHPLSEGVRTWEVRAVDRAGNRSSTSKRTLEYGSPPVAVLNAAPNPALAGSTVKLDGSASHDAEGPIADYAWDTDGDGSFDLDTGAAAATTLSFAQPGTYTLGLRVTDGVGKTSTTTTELRVNTNVPAGSLFGITINNGAQYTRDPNVVVGIKAPAAVTGVILSNDGGFLTPASFPLAKEVKWRLDSSGPERLPKIVYGRFRAGSIVLDNTFSDDIILDETPPVVEQASLASAAGTGATAAGRLRRFVIRVKATDSNSGVAKVQLAQVKRRPGKFIAYKRTERLKLASRPKFIRARDRAGNLSRWKRIR